jgi:cytochrome c556
MLQEFSHYMLSLPERSLRASAALLGGMANETGTLLLPQSVRRSKIYQATVERMLRITVEMVGDVRGVFPFDATTVEQLLMRKAAGNLIEVAGLLAAGWSPLWLLAATSDLIGGSRLYLRVLVDELRRVGALAPDAEIGSFEELLENLETTSGAMADAVDMPPLDTESIRASWLALQQNMARLPDAGRLAMIYSDLQVAAMREERPLLQVSALVAVGAVRAGLQFGNTYIFDYYRDALQLIAQEGMVVYLQRASAPYVERAARHFTPAELTHTERLLRRLSGMPAPEPPGEQLQRVPLEVQDVADTQPDEAEPPVRDGQSIPIVDESASDRPKP